MTGKRVVEYREFLERMGIHGEEQENMVSVFKRDHGIED